jgi:pyruvate dehydrogenase E1 component alpha subunit
MAPVVEGGFKGMKKTDWVVTGMRERIGAVLRGCSPERLVNGYAGARPYKLAPVSDAPGTRALHAVGLALGSQSPVLCFLGMASAASGDFHEALNAATLTGAPVIFLVTVMELGDDAPVGRQMATSPAALAEAFGIEVVMASPKVKDIQTAVAKARKNGTPSLIQVELESNA